MRQQILDYFANGGYVLAGKYCESINKRVFPTGHPASDATHHEDMSAGIRRRRSPFRTIGLVATVVMVTVLGIAWWHHPSDVDDPIRREDAQKAFYTMAYSTEGRAVIRKDTALAKAAEKAKTTYNIRGRVERFVADFALHDAKVLDGIGQDICRTVDLYRTRYRLPLLGSITNVSFLERRRRCPSTREFDAAWSLGARAHPEPEAALTRFDVVKPGGLRACNRLGLQALGGDWLQGAPL
jgi:hypothetical protein